MGLPLGWLIFLQKGRTRVPTITLCFTWLHANSKNIFSLCFFTLGVKYEKGREINKRLQYLLYVIKYSIYRMGVPR